MNAPDRGFTEPWQAQVLATALGLQEAGVVTPQQWSQALGAAIERARAGGDPDTGETYYLHVLDALQHLLAELNLVSGPALEARVADWEAAYRRTPHGQPVEL